ncbi:iron-containing redox enzyme family protein [Pseudomonas solani]|uniref:iron-containing redox enzyme family protein n=1 Tax=Pseudomonas solani TaxID=2731552 RepID=UPI003C2D6C99
MSVLSPVDTTQADVPLAMAPLGPAQRLYQELLQQPAENLDDARAFLHEQLRQAAALPCDLPSEPADLAAWSRRNAAQVTHQYAAYLEERRNGAGRRYFGDRAHALYFLRGVAPTKLVDGAWLHGTLRHWRDTRFTPLVRTFLEELGDGVAAQNHVLLYRRLLASQGCDDLTGLGDAHYLQGATQLALGALAEEFLPEVIGYNLGYEQLPLHLLISAFELDELDIDPYYFQLHVTIDNSATGHAHRAVQAVLDNHPLVADAEEFYRRVSLGYRLNDLGLGSRAVIADFDLERELLEMFERKRGVAGQVHSDYCRIEGRTVNQWLGADEGIAGFLSALQRRGWIRRHHDPAESRFWQLVQGERAAMFGVFSLYEQQLLHDWIAGTWERPGTGALSRNGVFRSRHRQPHMPSQERQRPSLQPRENPEQRQLLDELQRLDEARYEARLIELQGPATHWTPAGLLATRLFSELTR